MTADSFGLSRSEVLAAALVGVLAVVAALAQLLGPIERQATHRSAALAAEDRGDPGAARDHWRSLQDGTTSSEHDLLGAHLGIARTSLAMGEPGPASRELEALDSILWTRPLPAHLALRVHVAAAEGATEQTRSALSAYRETEPGRTDLDALRAAEAALSDDELRPHWQQVYDQGDPNAQALAEAWLASH